MTNQTKSQPPVSLLNGYRAEDFFDEMVGPAAPDQAQRLALNDLWRRTNGDAREYTWASMRNGEIVNEFRLDHALANDRFVERFDPRCRYDHGTRPAFSDHSAVVVDLAGPATLHSERAR